jgi:hypothetical protein
MSGGSLEGDELNKSSKVRNKLLRDYFNLRLKAIHSAYESENSPPKVRF